jgi:GxxExxY protein
MAQADLPHSGLTHTIIGTFFDTAKELGPGFSERVCQRSLQVALIDEGLQAEIDVPIRVYFRGRRVGRFFADLVVNETVLVEVKTATSIDDHMVAQILNYLHCAGGGIGLLVNFGRTVEFWRYVVGEPTIALPTLGQQWSAAGGLRPPVR